MKKLACLLGFCLSLTGVAGAAEAERPTLVIATYDSFVAKHGLGPAIFPLFEKKCGCKVQALASGDGAQLLSKLEVDAERGKPQAQVVLGLDQTTFRRAEPLLDAWGTWEPRGYAKVIQPIREARLGAGFLPFDYGVFAFMSDREQLRAAHLEAPRRLSDLLKPEWRRNVILEDPRTSTPGLAFLLYATEAGGDGFWARFKTQWLTLAPGWDGAYGLFLKKEAPLVWSYTTSQAYHESRGDPAGAQRRYRALVFEEGNPLQIEGAALVKGAWEPRQRQLARDFLEFLLSAEAQSLIPTRNWMLPVMPGTELPESFKNIPKPLKIISMPTDAAFIDGALVRWKQAIGSAR